MYLKIISEDITLNVPSVVIIDWIIIFVTEVYCIALFFQV